ncbi:Carboxy-terminal processing protease CtpA OS=Lysinibacillus sphaericus OX=1421 GN=ctpA_2 PE=3 SV=1 [Lysinibacillus sphaericus]
MRAAQQNMKFPTDTRILVNRYSASASEMLAASLQDQQSAILYGETTYGKGAMQGFFELHDGSYLKLTVGKFTNPCWSND